MTLRSFVKTTLCDFTKPKKSPKVCSYKMYFEPSPEFEDCSTLNDKLIEFPETSNNNNTIPGKKRQSIKSFFEKVFTNHNLRQHESFEADKIECFESCHGEETGSWAPAEEFWLDEVTTCQPFINSSQNTYDRIFETLKTDHPTYQMFPSKHSPHSLILHTLTEERDYKSCHHIDSVYLHTDNLELKLGERKFKRLQRKKQFYDAVKSKLDSTDIYGKMVHKPQINSAQPNQTYRSNSFVEKITSKSRSIGEVTKKLNPLKKPKYI